MNISGIRLTNSPLETSRLGKKFSRYLKPGAVVFLTGGLGSGKTTFVKGIARGLGIKKAVTSSSFILAREYPEKNFCHMDLYRINKKQFMDAGLQEYVSEKGITAIEWSEKIRALWGDFRRNKKYIVNFKILKDNRRKIIYYVPGD
ncbi:MAG: tRNA (adenosine(37)-N6)-threonylcarbamoyltransferase complex ATPase subunit type 1 TsaE [Elusimicrobia bacterium]|nr:tRNA (adenosine(37)-N6)-threonylcarbamoyltransferase complex ATPase subunit type 1 TsaE [Elusimicrobiota bacterium]